MEKVSIGKSVIVNDDNFIFCRRTYTVKQLEHTIYCTKLDLKDTECNTFWEKEGAYYSKELNIYLNKFKPPDCSFTLSTGDIIDVIQECYTSNLDSAVPKVSAFSLNINGMIVAKKASYSIILRAFEFIVRYIEGLK